MIERYENGEIALEVTRPTESEISWYLIEVGGFASILLKTTEWSELRELLEAYWEETDVGPHADG